MRIKIFKEDENMGKSDISINGTGNIFSGEYNKVVICGNASGEGKIKAKKIEVNGSLCFQGEIDSPLMIVNGQLRADKIISEKIEITGKIDSRDVLAKSLILYVQNECVIEKIQCEKMEIYPKKRVLFARGKNGRRHE